jgi:peroxiredoxin
MRRSAEIDPSPVLLDERAFQALIRWAGHHAGTLTEQLAALGAQIRDRLDEPQRKALAAALERLRMLQIVEQALALGDVLPELALPDADGRMWTGAELLDRGPLALAFVRGAWCPYCSLCLAALDRIAPLVAGAGGSLVVVVPAGRAELARIRAERGLTLTLLGDPDAAYARVCGVQYEMSDGQAALYRSFGLDLAAAHGWGLPVPATYVAGHDGRIAYAFADPDWSRRAEPGDILAAVARLVRPPPAPASA